MRSSPSTTPETALAATKELGEFDMKAWADSVANAIRSIKADQVSARLQEEFYRKSLMPSETKQ
jgi:creatinine amidohydrolase